jgi:hypothetical protein
MTVRVARPPTVVLSPCRAHLDGCSLTLLAPCGGKLAVLDGLNLAVARPSMSHSLDRRVWQNQAGLS